MSPGIFHPRKNWVFGPWVFFTTGKFEFLVPGKFSPQGNLSFWSPGIFHPRKNWVFWSPGIFHPRKNWVFGPRVFFTTGKIGVGVSGGLASISETCGFLDFLRHPRFLGKFFLPMEEFIYFSRVH